MVNQSPSNKRFLFSALCLSLFSLCLSGCCITGYATEKYTTFDYRQRISEDASEIEALRDNADRECRSAIIGEGYGELQDFALAANWGEFEKCLNKKGFFKKTHTRIVCKPWPWKF